MEINRKELNLMGKKYLSEFSGFEQVLGAILHKLVEHKIISLKNIEEWKKEHD